MAHSVQKSVNLSDTMMRRNQWVEVKKKYQGRKQARREGKVIPPISVARHIAICPVEWGEISTKQSVGKCKQINF